MVFFGFYLELAKSKGSMLQAIFIFLIPATNYWYNTHHAFVALLDRAHPS
jgi:hypothetical protein